MEGTFTESVEAIRIRGALMLPPILWQGRSFVRLSPRHTQYVPIERVYTVETMENWADF
jgi:hypothetical protein